MVINFLLKKGINSTPYSKYHISKKKKQPPTQPCAFNIPYFNMKLLKTLNNITTLKYF
jgi:hypothetical protein